MGETVDRNSFFVRMLEGFSILNAKIGIAQDSFNQRVFDDGDEQTEDVLHKVQEAEMTFKGLIDILETQVSCERAIRNVEDQVKAEVSGEEEYIAETEKSEPGEYLEGGLEIQD